MNKTTNKKPREILPFIGPFQLPTIERARSLARNFTAGTPESQERLAQYIAQTGDCVLHACAVLFGCKCGCADCAPGVTFGSSAVRS